MDPLAATTAKAASTNTTPSTTASTPAASTETTATKKSFATLFAEAEKDLKSGEKLTKVKGHEFARIKGGERDDMCVNLSGNARSGQAFDLIWRDGRCFHVYGGKGAGHVVVEVGTSKKDSTSSTTGTSSSSTSGTAGSASSAAATGGTSAA